MKELGEKWRTADSSIAGGIRAVLIGASIVLLAIPWLRRLRYLCIIGDDVQRMIDLQTLSLTERMFRPFNEHLAPLFELFTAATWMLAGRKLVNAPLAFTLASYVPFLLSLLMLFVLIRREWKSATIAGFSVILFVATPIYAECVFWFSASTFFWAMLFTLAALWLAGIARDRNSVWAWIGSALACLVAPMGSAIGLLAGPVSTIRSWPDQRPKPPFWREFTALAPLLGTVANLLFASYFRYHSVLAKSVRTTHDFGRGLSHVVQAPLYLVLSGYCRVRNAQEVVPYAVSAVFLVVGLMAIGVKMMKSNATDRRWLAIGVFLVGVGYPLIYCFRTWMVGVDSVLTIQRYHLFPCLGLVLIATVWLAPQLRRLESRPLAAPAASLSVAIVLMLINRPGMAANLGYFRMQPDQKPALAMMDHLAQAARLHDLSREQVLKAFDPLEPRWTLAGWNALRMLPQHPVKQGASLTDFEAREVLLASLSKIDRSWLLADRNITNSLEPAATWPNSATNGPGEFVSSLRFHPLDPPEHYQCDGWPSFLEYRFPPGVPSPKALQLSGLPNGKTLELWWSEDSQQWTSQERVVIRVEQAEVGPRSDWVLPLERLPQLNPSKLRRLRITVREAGPVAIGAPGLLR